MTPLEHKKIASALKAKATRLRNKSKSSALTLSQKLELRAQESAILDRLHEHKLNYFELTQGERG